MAEKSIYLVLDMENDLVHEDGPNGKAGFGPQVQGRGIIGKTKTAIAKARAAGVLIGYVRVGFSSNYQECPPKSPVFSGAPAKGLFKLGEWGTEVHPELKPEPQDVDIVKHRVSPFYATKLEAVLRAHSITRIFCSGVSTNAVVQACIRDGHDRDFSMVLLEDCCASGSQEEHDAALANVRRFCSLVTDSASVDFGA